jgi:ABC-type glycerol-3-phosphate transport system substrate-binding protein
MAVAAPPLLQACGGSSSSGSTSAHYSMWALSDTVAMQKYFTDKYRKTVNKDFKVSITEVPSGQSHRAKIITSASSGNLPDILDDSMNYGSDFATYNIFEPLDLPSDYGDKNHLYERVWKWFNTGNIPGYQGDEYTFGSPYAISVYVPTYRVDLFEKADVQFPNTWDELVSAGKALTQAPRRYALSVPTSGDLIDEFHPFLMQAGVQYVNDDLTEAFPTRDAAYKAFQFYSDLVNKYHVAPKQTPDRFSTDPAQRLTSGQVGMTTLQTVSVNALKAVIGNRFGADSQIFVNKFWAGPGGRGGYFNSNGLFLRKGLENPQPAIDYMQWMLKPEQQNEMYSKFTRIPANTSAWQKFASDEQFKVYTDSIEFSERQGGFRGWKLAEFAIDTAVERVVINGAPVKQAVDQCARDMLQALQNA